MKTDFAELNNTADLLALAERDTSLHKVAGTQGGEYAGACPFCGGDDRFRVQPERHRWLCRGCGGDRWHSPIDYVMRRDNADVRAAAAALSGGAALSTDFIPVRPEPCKSTTTTTPLAVWTDAATRLVDAAEAALWSPTGARALDWLRSKRGLTDTTIKAARLGLVDRGAQCGLYAPARGITIPCFVGGAVQYIKIRTPAGTPRYTSIRGGKAALYGLDRLAGLPVVVVTEGEFDALLLWQVAHDLVDVVTAGSASGQVDDRALPYLIAARRFVIVTDNDDAGHRAAATWLDLVGTRGTRALPPAGKDITDAWQAGHDLRAWITELVTDAKPVSDLDRAWAAGFDALDRATDAGNTQRAEAIAAELDRLQAAVWTSIKRADPVVQAAAELGGVVGGQ